MMKNFVVVLMLAIAVLALPYPSQAASAPKGIPGYFNPATGTFAPLTIYQAPLGTAVVRTGTVNIAITLSIESSIGIGEPISCNASISSFDASFSNSASASGLVIRTGTTGKVTIPIPYDWTMAATGEQATISVSCDEGSFGTGAIGHTLSFTVPALTVPAKAGTVTTKSLVASM
jgi:hypothetical protein